MDIDKLQKWSTNYEAWRREAEKEAFELLKSKGYAETALASKYLKINVYEDGRIKLIKYHKNGQVNEFQSGWTKHKVTSWKESTYYIESPI